MSLLTQREFAVIAEVSQQGIAKAVKAGRITITKGKIDTEGAETIEYLRQRKEVKVGHRSEPNHRPKQIEQPVESESDDMPAAPPRGSKAALDIELTKQRVLSAQLKNALQIGTVVLREVYHKGIWQPINQAFIQMLADVPKSLAAQVVPAVKAGNDITEIESMIRKAMSSVIKAARQKCIDTMEAKPS
jgi:phage terminase Nu1 subunit (DNA packaging protein)